jgi:hypothetical protein
MLNALNDSGAEYLVVGAHALATYGQPRATGDFDIWIRSTAENVDRVWAALDAFGAPRRKLTKKDLCAPIALLVNQFEAVVAIVWIVIWFVDILVWSGFVEARPELQGPRIPKPTHADTNPDAADKRRVD